METIWVVGFYHSDNLGDDVFGWVFEHLIPDLIDATVELVPSHQLAARLPVPPEVRAVIVGGGDLINDYFMAQLRPLFEAATCPVYAVGIGIPYPKLIDEGYLDGFDYIMYRSAGDYDALTRRYGHNHALYTPDLAWFSESIAPSPEITAPPREIKRVGIFLARPMYDAREPTAYQTIVNNVAYFIYELLTRGLDESVPRKQSARRWWNNRRTIQPRRSSKQQYEVELVPFGTSDAHPSQDDRIMIKHVVYALHMINGGKMPARVTVRADSPPIDQLVHHFRSRYDYALCSRFHAHVYALMAEVPLISMSCTRKVEQLMIDAHMENYLYSLPVDEVNLYPIECNARMLIHLFDTLLDNEAAVRTSLRHYAQANRERVETETRTSLRNLLFYLPNPVSRFRQLDPATRVAEFLVLNQARIGSVVPTTERRTPTPDQRKEVTLLLQPGGIAQWGGVSAGDLDRVTRLISMLVVGRPDSPYNWGLREQLLQPTYSLRESCEWIHRDYMSGVAEFPDWKRRNTAPLEDRVLHLEHTRDACAFDGVHRSGWGHVMGAMRRLHNPRSPELFDTYLDETFGWRYEVMRDVGKIPYAQSWRGILHHTPDTTVSDNNLGRLFERNAWRQSLHTCNGLITLSESLAAWVRKQLAELGFHRIEVTALVHPTETAVPHFDWLRYVGNPERRLVQVGGWLRNTYAIYALPNHIALHGVHKAALKGRGMDHYYLDDFDHFAHAVQAAWDQVVAESADTTPPPMQGALDTSPSCVNELGVGAPTGTGGSAPARVSPWVTGARDAALASLDAEYHSVELIEHIDNDAYDRLLSRNIVFLNLIDCSAVNTIIECIVRHTPVLVNPLPAVVEYLGPDYPLYYHSLEEAAQLAINNVRLHGAHVYLRNLDKGPMQVDHFVDRIKYMIVPPPPPPPSTEPIDLHEERRCVVAPCIIM